ncbi:MAG: FHA domain-containing protein [Anaerolineae bacterium]|nr:FHA domain-containing protein [Anaerolineae bacterium]
MITCPYCGHKDREGVMFCEECGQNLQRPAERTITVSPTKRFEQSTADLAARVTWGTARFGQDAFIIIHIRDVTEPIILRPSDKLVMGRADGTSPTRPDLDLTPYGALERGVSRIHAAIGRSDDTLTLVDLGSANGTYLNGQRLVTDQPRILRDGDEIRLGRLVAHVYFK